MKRCENCGLENADESKFCKKCGTKFPEKKLAKFCRFCGKEATEGNLFCTGCGKSLEMTAAQPTIQPKPVTVEKPVQTQEKKNLLPIIIAVVVVVIALVVGVIWFMQNNPTSNEADGDSSSKVENQIENDDEDDVDVNSEEKDEEVKETESLVVEEETESGTEAQLTDSEYILPTSNTEYLTLEDLQGLTAEQCRIARNELYARYGRKFTDEGLKAYFESKSWYIGTIEPEDFKEDMLNEYEIANRDLIVEYETLQGYR